MRAIVQRVKEANVSTEGESIGSIQSGLLILLGISDNDSQEDIEWMVRKITSMRIFPDDSGQMNKSLNDINGELLIVSQFTLYASTKKGNRPSFTKAAPPSIAIPLYESFIKSAEAAIQKNCATGKFGTDMQVSLTNDGPVTIMIDSHLRE